MSTSIDPATTIGPVRLTVADLERSRDFYQRAIGLHELGRDAGAVSLGPAPEAPLVELVGRPGAPPRPRRSTGLFHLAILVPDRGELARSLRRAVDAGAAFSGASDHLVSEALYLDDPEGNGIEIYRDRPREEWRTGPGGEIEMATLPLDLDGVLGALPRDGADEGMDPATVMGHVHLQVRDIPEAEAFYADALGFDPTVRGYPGALFVSAGGYHHHLGLNTWGTAGAPAPPEGARGLDRLEIVVPDAAGIDRIEERARAAGVPTGRGEEGLSLGDPSGNRVLVRR
jgi:catechol 2,3-dioxygenase